MHFIGNEVQFTQVLQKMITKKNRRKSAYLEIVDCSSKLKQGSRGNANVEYAALC